MCAFDVFVSLLCLDDDVCLMMLMMMMMMMVDGSFLEVLGGLWMFIYLMEPLSVVWCGVVVPL